LRVGFHDWNGESPRWQRPTVPVIAGLLDLAPHQWADWPPNGCGDYMNYGVTIEA